MKKVISVILILCFSLCFSACKNDDTDKKTNYLKLSDFEKLLDGENADIAYSRKLDKSIDGIESSSAKLVLVSYEKPYKTKKYAVCIADYDKIKVKLFDYGSFLPLRIIKEEIIDNFSAKNQIENLDIIYEFIAQYGTNCFENSNNSALYIKKLTKNDNPIRLSDAQLAIEENISSKSNELSVYSECQVIFEPASAVPKYYAFKETDTNSKTCWRAMNSDFVELPGVSYDSFEELKNFLTEDFRYSDSDDEDSADKQNPSKNDNNADESQEQPESDKKDTDKKDTDKKDTDKKDTDKKDNNENIFYRVRKSADDSSSQIGAFTVLENAIALADSRSSEGYKVYDNSGRLVYAP